MFSVIISPKSQLSRINSEIYLNVANFRAFWWILTKFAKYFSRKHSRKTSRAKNVKNSRIFLMENLVLTEKVFSCGVAKPITKKEKPCVKRLLVQNYLIVFYVSREFFTHKKSYVLPAKSSIDKIRILVGRNF